MVGFIALKGFSAIFMRKPAADSFDGVGNNDPFLLL